MKRTLQYFFSCFDTFDLMHIFFPLNLFFFLNIYKKKIIKKRLVLLSVKCFEHFCEPSPNELAAFKLVAKILQESNLKEIISNITVITLNKFGKRARGCCVHVFLVLCNKNSNGLLKDLGGIRKEKQVC